MLVLGFPPPPHRPSLGWDTAKRPGGAKRTGSKGQGGQGVQSGQVPRANGASIRSSRPAGRSLSRLVFDIGRHALVELAHSSLR